MTSRSDPPGHLEGAGRFVTGVKPRPRSLIDAQMTAKVAVFAMGRVRIAGGRALPALASLSMVTISRPGVPAA